MFIDYVCRNRIKRNIGKCCRKHKAEHEETNYAIGYLVPTTSTYSFTEEGGVATDGLRLRKEPSFDSTILELMYFGEVVKIDLDKSTMWSYVKI